MTDTEVIAAQAKRILELEQYQADARERFARIHGIIYCIGGPLNDNRLQFTREQQAVFFRIAEQLSD